MSTPADDDPGGLEQVPSANRVPGLTGLRAVAALTAVLAWPLFTGSTATRA